MTTTLSNQGIIWRGIPAKFESQPLTICRICEVERPRGSCHCDVCQLDHHCPWMGKCIAKNNLKLFNVSVMCIFGSIFLAGFASMVL
ncbi:uncharacterized protein [Blastocystis hominis]|uniref:Palmitoyltransferase n=1 Tax=Blastocystis hominis TaxID=12968 RepID=D8M1H6_BLAHO|nr:uncharacterized protein [Blastocystis hominis]CBK21915.2 unnamed protein product [Blastocystis hominis]|eukprot:XP_012895963.1 uncharacterized protein [Blastocystis hominis]